MKLASIALLPTLVLTIAARFYPAVHSSLRRDPDALGHGEVWRLVSPVLVQADFLEHDGWWRAVAVLMMVAAILCVAERELGAGRSLVLYCVGALVGHGVGELWQPYGSGCSVAGCGVLGGVAVWLLSARPLQVRVGAALVIAGAVVAACFEDIHGPPLLAGAFLGRWLLRSVPLPRRLS
ncbi:MAG: rhomboid family intramembrane serine protease [Deltaproteobacteria bacterium]